MGDRRDAVTTVSGRNLTHCFGVGDVKSTVLHDVSIDLCAGQIALLMGPSGSGKSTLMAILSGFLGPNGGQVTAMGEDIWAMSEREREDFRLKYMGFVAAHDECMIPDANRVLYLDDGRLRPYAGDEDGSSPPSRLHALAAGASLL